MLTTFTGKKNLQRTLWQKTPTNSLHAELPVLKILNCLSGNKCTINVLSYILTIQKCSEVHEKLL